MKLSYIEQLNINLILFKEVPIEFRTPELCEVAVKICGLNLEYVPFE